MNFTLHGSKQRLNNFIGAKRDVKTPSSNTYNRKQLDLKEPLDIFLNETVKN